ncbi:MAG: ATP-dependent DNA helicase RecG, partial [Rhizobiales bacterium]|nr:ATP-dependent DNA helicase RecG [Hyphomicrobiales bacterium]
MRPSRLDPFFAPVRTLPGVGPKSAELIARATAAEGDEATVRDVLFHLPASFIDRRRRPPLYEMPPSGHVTVEGTVERLEKPSPGRALWRVILAEGNAAIQLVYFHAESEWLRKLFPIGARRIVSGEVEWFDMRPQIRHPEYVLSPERAGDLPLVEPVYALTAGLSPKLLRRAVAAGLERLPDMPEWISADLLAARGWPSFRAALREVHQPERIEASGPEGAAWQRLAFDELLASQLTLALVRGNTKRGRGVAWRSESR